MTCEGSIDELVSFLRNDRREVSITSGLHPSLSIDTKHPIYVRGMQVRQIAVDLVKGLTGNAVGLSKLSERSQQLLPELLKLIADRDKIQQSAVTSLVNLCQVPDDTLRKRTSRCPFFVHSAV